MAEKIYLDPPPEAVVWLEAARAQKLLIQRCDRCRSLQHYPRNVCAACGSIELDWIEASGRGVVHAFTVVHQNRLPGWADQTPYVVAMIDLEEGVRMTSNVVGCDPGEVRVGLPVEVTFVDDGQLMLPKFRPSP